MGITERKNRQKQALRERILDASRRIVMRDGFAALTMRKIADAIEYSPATLYLHFASRDEIAQALCEEGYAQLLATFEPHARIADPAERLKALGRAYIAFGVEHPQTYRLIFMEDPSYTGAALGGAARKAQASADEEAGAEVEDATTSSASPDSAVHTDDDPGAAALHIMLGALEELKAAGRLSASADLSVWAEAFWATLHGIVALNLTCPVFPTAPLDTVLNLTLDVWFGPSNAGVEPAAKAVPEPAAQPTPEPRAKPKAASA